MCGKHMAHLPGHLAQGMGRNLGAVALPPDITPSTTLNHHTRREMYVRALANPQPARPAIPAPPLQPLAARHSHMESGLETYALQASDASLQFSSRVEGSRPAMISWLG